MASTLSASVYRQLLHGLLAGDPAPDDPLPSERTLSERFGVNRHAVREAVKRLQQAGLVRVSQGGATRVLDWREHGGLALMQDLVEADPDSPELLRAALEMRLCVGVDAARRCAERAPAGVLAELSSIAERQVGDDFGETGETESGDEPGAHAQRDRGDDADADAYEALWRAIVLGADNVAYRLALNSLVAGENGERLRILSLDEARDLDAQRALVEAIAAGEADRAGALATDLLERTLAVAHAAFADGAAAVTTPSKSKSVRATPAPPDRATPDRATPGRPTPDRATPDRPTPDHATPDRATRAAGRAPQPAGGRSDG